MSKIVGTCLGECAKEGDVSCDPQTGAYKTKAGDRTAEIDGRLSQPESLRASQEALSDADGENIKTDMPGAWAKDVGARHRRACLGGWGSDRTDEAKTAAEAAEDGTTARPAAAARIRRRAGETSGSAGLA